MMLSLDRRPRGLVAHACHTLVRISGAVRWWGLHLQNFLKQSGSDELHFNFQILNRYQMTQISLVARFNTISEKEASIEQCRKDSLQIHSWFSAVCLKRVKYDKFWNFEVFGPPSCASTQWLRNSMKVWLAVSVYVRASVCACACVRKRLLEYKIAVTPSYSTSTGIPRNHSLHHCFPHKGEGHYGRERETVFIK